MKIYPSLVQCNYCNKWCNKSETAKSECGLKWFIVDYIEIVEKHRNYVNVFAHSAEKALSIFKHCLSEEFEEITVRMIKSVLYKRGRE